MQKIPVPVSFLQYNIERPSLLWGKMKDALGDMMKKYNDYVQELDSSDSNKQGYKKLAVSMETTAKQILWIFCQKFKAGQVRNTSVKFCRTYLAESYGIAFRAPALVTISRHIERFLEMPDSFLIAKNRSTLGLPGQDINCIELELDPRIVIFEKDIHNVAIRQGKALNSTPPEWQKRAQKNEMEREHQALKKSMVEPSKAPTELIIKTQEQTQEIARRQPAKSIGDLFSQNFFNPSQHTPEK